MRKSIKMSLGSLLVVILLLTAIVVPNIHYSNDVSSDGIHSSWYTSLQQYAQEQGMTVEQLTANWTADDWWHWYRYEGNPIWGSTNITDTMLATDWVHLSNVGNLTWGANYDIQAKYNLTSGYLDWIGKSNNFSAFNLKSTASYIIWKDGSTIYATNGTTGLIDYSRTNASAVIQYAIDNLPSSSSVIYIKGGEYILDIKTSPYTGLYEAIEINKTATITGEYGKTILKLKDGIDIGTDDVCVFYISADNVVISNLKIDANYANYVSANYMQGIFHRSGNYLQIRHNIITGVKGYSAIYGDAPNTQHEIIDSNYILLPNGQNGISLHNGATHSIITNNIITSLTSATSGEYIGVGIFLDTVDHCIISNNYIFKPNLAGIRAYDTVTYCEITNNIIYKGVTNAKGIWLQGKDATTGSNYNTIKNNIIDSIDYGVYIDSYSNNNTIKNNEFYNIVGISDSGTDNNFRNNIGYTTENSGTSEITGDGTNTSFSISHGLATTPSQVLVTPTNSSMASATWWVSTKSSTTFTITFSTAPSNGDKLSFDWYAEV